MDLGNSNNEISAVFIAPERNITLISRKNNMACFMIFSELTTQITKKSTRPQILKTILISSSFSVLLPRI